MTSSVTMKSIAAALRVTKQAVQARAAKESWPYAEVAVKGGRQRLYAPLELPEDVREALLARDLEEAVPARRHAQGVAATEIGKRLALAEQGKLPSQLEGWRRDIQTARLAILCEIDRLVARHQTTRAKAVKALLEAIRAGTLAPELARLIPVANARDGAKRGQGGRTLARSSIFGWLRIRDEIGPDGLAPKAPPSPAATAPEKTWWHKGFLKLYGRPQKPSIAWCLEKMAARFPEDYLDDIRRAGLAPGAVRLPSHDQARRFLAMLSPQQIARGRMGQREAKRLRCYVVRGVADLWPGAVYVADGHTFDAMVAHPVHGQPFRPEITGVIDVFSRKLVGWSAGVVEKTTTVADAMLNAFVANGLCDIWYVDRGKGFNNKAMDDDVTGLLSRVGVLKENSLPYNSQARGAVERSHKSIWIRAAKSLPTFMGLDMDPEARDVAHKIVKAEIKQTGTSRLLPAWRPTVDFLAAEAEAYNNRPHSELPKTRDPETGRIRHMTPSEVWDAGVLEHGAPEVLEESEALAAFRPQVRRKTVRGMLSWIGNQYFHRALEPLHGREVRVGYDARDAGKVWVYDMEGQFVCQALFEGNKRSFFAVTKDELDQRRRTEGRLRRHDAHRPEIEAELNPAALIEHAPAVALDPEALAMAEAEIAAMAAREAPQAPARIVQHPNARPTFFSDMEWAAWLAEHPDRATDDDRRLLADRLRMGEFRMLLEMEGIALDPLKSLAA